MRIFAFDRQTSTVVQIMPQDVPGQDVPMDERRYVDVRIEHSGAFVPAPVEQPGQHPELVAVPDAG